MLTNGDQDGIWSMFKAGGECVCSCWCVSPILISICRGSMLYHHVPWLAHYAKRLPMSPEVKKMRQFVLGRTAMRYNAGATSKDLFYYLVNYTVLLDILHTF